MGRPRRKSGQKRSGNRQVGKQTAYRLIRKRSDGTQYEVWRCAYTALVYVAENENEPITGGDGKEVRRYAQGDTAKAAEAAASILSKQWRDYEDWIWDRKRAKFLDFSDWIHESQKQSDSHSAQPKIIPVDPSLVTFTEAYQGHVKRRVLYDPNGNPRPLSDSYVRRTDYYLKHIAEISDIPLSKLSLLQIDECFTSVQKRLARGTCARLRAWLITIGKYALQSKFWEHNLFESIGSISFKPLDTTKRIYSLAEIDQIWNAAKTDRHRALLILLRLGLRFGEATGLTCYDIIDDETIAIRYTQVRRREKLSDGTKLQPFLAQPKTISSMAKVRVPKRWMLILEASLKHAQRAYVGTWDVDGETPRHLFVVPNEDGLIWQEATALASFKRLLKQAGVNFDSTGRMKRHSVWHSFRYTYASEIVALGANDIELKYLMRHSDAKMTKDVYARIREENRDLYKKYKKNIKLPVDFNEEIARFDTDRRLALRKKQGTMSNQQKEER